MPWFGEPARRRRLEAEAYRWVLKISDDQQRHEAGLRRWIGTDQERATIYNDAYRAVRHAGRSGAEIYGTLNERGGTPVPRGIRSVPYGRMLAVAAGLILISVGVALALSLLAGRVTGPRLASAAPTLLATRGGETRSVTLADGSRVRLAADTRIITRFTAGQRRLTLLGGSARFIVAHDAGRPFIVAAGGGWVLAHGTVFDVAYAHQITVRLISGTVEVGYPQYGGAHGAIRNLKAGEQLVFEADPATGSAPIASGDTDDPNQSAGLTTFDDVPVQAIIAEANRHSDRSIILRADDVADRRIFVDVDLRDAADVAHKLASLLGLHVDESGHDVIVLMRTP